MLALVVLGLVVVPFAIGYAVTLLLGRRPVLLIGVVLWLVASIYS